MALRGGEVFVCISKRLNLEMHLAVHGSSNCFGRNMFKEI